MNADSLNIKSISMDGVGWPIPLPKVSEKESASRRNLPHLLLIDDDPIFCKRMAKAAKQNHILLSTCSSVQEMVGTSQYPRYDVALIDYYLGDTTAPEIIPMFKGKMPVILISENKGAELSDASWPEPVKRFVSKSKGMKVLLEEAVRAVNLESAVVSGGNLDSGYIPGFSKSASFWILGAAIVGLVSLSFVLSISGLLNTNGSTSQITRGNSSTTIQDIKLEPVPLDRFNTPIKWDQAPVIKNTDLG